MQLLLVRRWICNFLNDSHLYFIYYYYLLLLLFYFIYLFVSNPPFRIIHARISNNLNKEFIMMTKFTMHVQRHRSLVFKDSQLLYFARLRSRQIIVLVSVLPEFAEQSWLILD